MLFKIYSYSRCLLCIMFFSLWGGCFPFTRQQAGEAAIFVSPLLFLAAVLILFSLLLLWRRRFPNLRMNFAPALVTLGVLSHLALWLHFTSDVPQVQKWLPEVCKVVVISYLAFVLFTYRIWFKRSPHSTVFTWAAIPPIGFLILSAFLFWVDWTEDSWLIKVLGVIWMLPMTGAILVVTLLLIYFVEAWWYGKPHKNKTEKSL